MSGVNNPSGGELAAHLADTTAAHAGTSLSVSATDVLLGRASSGAGAVEEIACTAAGRALLDDADAAAQRATLGVSSLDHEHQVYLSSITGSQPQIFTEIPATDGYYIIIATFKQGVGSSHHRTRFAFRISDGGTIVNDATGVQEGPADMQGYVRILIVSGKLSFKFNIGGVCAWFHIFSDVTISSSALTGWTSAAVGNWTGIAPTFIHYASGQQYFLDYLFASAQVASPKLTRNDTGDLTIEAHNSSGSDIDLKTQALSRIKINYDGTLTIHATTLADLQSQIGASGWTTVTKTADETINTDTTVTADSALLFAVAANTKYRFRVLAFFSTGATPGFKFSILGPSSPTLFKARNQYGNDSNGMNGSVITTSYYSGVAVGGAGGGGGFALVEAVLHNGANAGNIEFGWAQNTSDAGSTTVLAGSFIEYKVVA